MTVARAGLLGLACGMRTFTGPGVLALRGHLGDDGLRRLAIAAALGEFLADKTPLVPRRTWAPSLGARLASGAFCGAAVADLPGAAAGAAGAALAGFGAYRARTAVGERTSRPDPLVGALEDLVAISVAGIATRELPRRPPRRADAAPRSLG